MTAAASRWFDHRRSRLAPDDLLQRRGRAVPRREDRRAKATLHALRRDLAQRHRLKLPLAAATLAQYRQMVAVGLGHLDKSGIAELKAFAQGLRAFVRNHGQQQPDDLGEQFQSMASDPFGEHMAALV